MRETITVDVKRIVRLLGTNLYTTPRVVIRELVQNAYDAVRLRFGEKTPTSGKIAFKVNRSPSGFTIFDNGVGMDDDQLRKYLSRLAAGIKAHERNSGRSSQNIIGEFGIGFFSAFQIADQVTVRTRMESARTAFEWRPIDVMDYEIREIPDWPVVHGTEVDIVLQPSSSDFASEQKLREIIEQYCIALDCPIVFAGSDAPANEMKYPWELRSREKQRAWLERRLNRTPREFEVKEDAQNGQVKYSYALVYADPVHTNRELHAKRMFVTDRLKFVDEHFEFLDVIVRCDALTLNLSREGIIDDAAFHALKAGIENSILSWMKLLLRKRGQDEELAEVFEKHQHSFRRLARGSARDLDRLWSLLLFPLANEEEELVTISEYIAQNKYAPEAVVYIDLGKRGSGDNSRQERLLLIACETKGLPVIVIRSAEDFELCRACAVRSGVQMKPLLSIADQLLQGGHVSKNLERVRKNFENLTSFRVTVGKLTPLLPMAIAGDQLVINEDNRFIRELSSLDLNLDTLRPIYSSAVVIAQTLNKTNADAAATERIFDSVGRSFTDWSSDLKKLSTIGAQLDAISDRWWSGPRAIGRLENRRVVFRKDTREYFARCFIVCSFAPVYRDMINVVKEVFGDYGIWAETAGEINNIDIFVKICSHIDHCDFAVVDITENNPNVMLELGLLIARRKPAIILRQRSVAQKMDIKVPADIIGIERIEYDNVTEDLRSKLRKVAQRLKEGSENA